MRYRYTFQQFTASQNCWCQKCWCGGLESQILKP